MSSSLSLTLNGGGNSQLVAVSTTHAESTLIVANHILLYVDTACYARASLAPVAITGGTDQYIPAGIHYRIPWNNDNGWKLSLITLTGTGNAYISPGV